MTCIIAPKLVKGIERRTYSDDNKTCSGIFRGNCRMLTVYKNTEGFETDIFSQLIKALVIWESHVVTMRNTAFWHVTSCVSKFLSGCMASQIYYIIAWEWKCACEFSTVTFMARGCTSLPLWLWRLERQVQVKQSEMSVNSYRTTERQR